MIRLSWLLLNDDSFLVFKLSVLVVCVRGEVKSKVVLCLVSISYLAIETLRWLEGSAFGNSQPAVSEVSCTFLFKDENAEVV